MKYLKIVADGDGNSRFAEGAWPLQLGDFTPPSPAGYFVSQILDAEAVLMMHHPPGYKDRWHPAPALVLGILLRGILRIRTSNGDARILEPGDQFLAADREGKGHLMEEVKGDAYDLVLVILEEEPQAKPEEHPQAQDPVDQVESL